MQIEELKRNARGGGGSTCGPWGKWEEGLEDPFRVHKSLLMYHIPFAYIDCLYRPCKTLETLSIRSRSRGLVGFVFRWTEEMQDQGSFKLFLEILKV